MNQLVLGSVTGENSGQFTFHICKTRSSGGREGGDKEGDVCTKSVVPKLSDNVDTKDAA